MNQYFHSVTLDEEKCMGCTNCIKRCPTEAIRVHNGKARIINERCIDCGECIRICPYHAKKAISDTLEQIDDFKYKVIIPAPAIYGQFKQAHTRNQILNSLKSLGFDAVFEVAKGAEIVSHATKKLLSNGISKKPLISSACPAVVRLIQVRFPELIDNLVKIESPMEVSAYIVKAKISAELGIPLVDIGVFFLSPCAAKVTAVRAPYEKEKSDVDGVIAIHDIYLKVLNSMQTSGTSENLEIAGFEGIRWANPGGESLALGTDQFLAVDGIHNCIKIFEEVEDDKLSDVEFIEALACTGGCLGGCLTVENLYVAKTRLKKFVDDAKDKATKESVDEEDSDLVEHMKWTSEIIYKPILKLDQDIGIAMKKLTELEDILKRFPGLDCGACGAPTCRALAEDVVRELAMESDCIFKMREKMKALMKNLTKNNKQYRNKKIRNKK